MTCFKFTIPFDNMPLKIIYFILNTCLLLLSVTGNSIIIYLIWTKSILKTPTCYLISALALSDFLTAIFGQMSYYISVCFFQDVSCTVDKAITFMNASSCTSSLLFLSLISRDRFLHVSKGIRYSEHTSTKFSIIASITTCFFGMFIASLFVFENQSVRIASTFVFATLGASSFGYICIKSRQINRLVTNHVKEMQQALKRGQQGTDEDTISSYKKIEGTVNRSIFSVIILFFVAWTPVIILMIIFTFYNIIEEPIGERFRIAFAWGSLASYFNGALNPVIYAYRCDAIGREIRKVIANLACRANRVQPVRSENMRNNERERRIAKGVIV